MTLQDVLAPIEIKEFVGEYIGERYVVIKGSEGRFHRLFSWQDLNEALSRMRVNEQRVSLVQNARPIPRDSYVQTSQSGRAENVIGSAVVNLVLQGATLVVNGVDELFPEVRRLAESCEEAFQVYVSANLYAGWRSDNGFDVHWDAHDTLIVQVRGRKNWKLWRPTRLHPAGGDGRDVAPRPTDEPALQGTLEDGDTLYMPRGWWHVACPRDEPSVHVTLGLRHSTGLDLLEWAVQKARDSVCARMNVPHWEPAQSRTNWLNAVREVCNAALSDDAIERFMEDSATRARARPIVRLPEAVPRNGPPVTDGTPLRLVRGRRLYFRPIDRSEMVSFTVQGSEWKCHRMLEPALTLLNHVKPSTLREMKSVIDERAKPLLSSFITSLVIAGVVWPEMLPERDLTGVSH